MPKAESINEQGRQGRKMRNKTQHFEYFLVTSASLTFEKEKHDNEALSASCSRGFPVRTEQMVTSHKPPIQIQIQKDKFSNFSSNFKSRGWWCALLYFTLLILLFQAISHSQYHSQQ